MRKDRIVKKVTTVRTARKMRTPTRVRVRPLPVLSVLADVRSSAPAIVSPRARMVLI